MVVVVVEERDQSGSCRLASRAKTLSLIIFQCHGPCLKAVASLFIQLSTTRKSAKTRTSFRPELSEIRQPFGASFLPKIPALPTAISYAFLR
jgi:hypothetical protein